MDVRAVGELTDMQNHVKTSWVVIPEQNAYVAVCLEYGFATSAKTMEDLGPEIGRYVCVHQFAEEAEEIEPFASSKRAPEKYWEQFQKGIKLIMHIEHVHDAEFRLSNAPRMTPAGAR